ncbi:MAG: DUF362 domain-containing protein [Anaerolineae bacterium]
MSHVRRREFLCWLVRAAGLAAGGGLLAACSRPEPPTPTAIQTATPRPLPPTGTLTSTREQRPTPTSTTTRRAAAITSPAPGETPTPAAPTETPTLPALAPTPAGTPDLVVARGGEPEALVRQALAALGGMGRFVKPGDDVIVKPNICVAYHTYEYAATTNPWVVGTLVRLALEAGARRVRVMDSPFGGGPEEAYVRSGIQEQVLAAGGQMELMASFKFADTSIPQGVDIKRWSVYGDVLKADVVINVPVAKHHNLARLTLGMKNLMGVIQNRSALHRNLGQRLADLTSLIRPQLTVVDAVRILVDHGPTGGNLADVRKLDTVIASPDIVATDAYAATLFGLKPDDLDYVRAGAAMGLGRSDLGSLKVEEITA